MTHEIEPLRSRICTLLKFARTTKAAKLSELLARTTNAANDRRLFAELLVVVGDVRRAIQEYRDLIYDFHLQEHVERLIVLWREHEFKKRPLWYRSNTCFLNNRPEYAKYIIGDYSYCPEMVVDSYHMGCTLRMGKFCSLAGGTRFLLQQEHNIKACSTYAFGYIPECNPAPPLSKGDIVLGNDIWIGAHSRILSGVTIGDGAVIGLGSIVVKNVPPYAIVGGAPARIIRMRYPDAVIERLLDLQWWNMDLETVRRLSPYLCADDVNAFIDRAAELSGAASARAEWTQ